jgi:BTB/POZ domain-containing protein KCTD9
MSTVEKWKEKIPRKFEEVIEQPILTSFLVLICLSFLVLGLSYPYYRDDFHEMYSQVLAEAHGMLFDIAVIGILIFWLNKNGEKRQRIRTYKDEIDDFRLWESEEAAYRTVGNVKRLNRHNIYDINLVNCYLVKTNLNHVILKEANLNYGNLSSANLIESNLENARLNQTNLENANLNQANLIGAYASGANFKDAYLIKANLEKAFLIKANFKNAFLMEANLNGAYLNGADLENANLYKADLRNAIGLTLEQIASVKTIYLAQLDEELLAQINAECPELLGK